MKRYSQTVKLIHIKPKIIVKRLKTKKNYPCSKIGDLKFENKNWHTINVAMFLHSIHERLNRVLFQNW